MGIDLLDLSPNGLNPLDLDDALQHKERARMVQLDSPSKAILELKRVYKLDLGSVKPPSWIGELKHLRMLQCMADISKLPPAVLGLPKLRFLHFDDSSLTTLDGVEKLRSLETITVCRTPASKDETALAAVAAKIKGGKPGNLMPGIDVKREPAKPKQKGKALAAALNADEIDDHSDLRGVDLAGATFEDLYVTHDLRNAKLAGTTWRRCDFDFATLAGADLTGATFDNCYFSSVYDRVGNLGKIKGSGVTFTRCGGSLDLAGADLRNAKFVDLESDVHFTLEKINGQGMELHATFCSEKEHAIKAKGADLRGARIVFDVTPRRRDAIAKKPTSRFAWKTDHLKGAKTDKTTQVTYTPLPVKGAKPTSGVDPKGAAAKSLGQFHAPNASLWALVVDARDAAQWGGGGDDGDGPDFQRALAKEDGPITVGKAKGVLAQIGDCGWSFVWQVGKDIALVNASMHADDRGANEKALAVRVAQWTPKKTSKLGTVEVKSGALALLLPYRDGAFTDAELKKAKTTVVKDKDHDRMLLPMPNGKYDIVTYAFGPKPGYEDELGEYYEVTRIVRAK
jgi:hypothetical protein